MACEVSDNVEVPVGLRIGLGEQFGGWGSELRADDLGRSGRAVEKMNV